MPDRYVITGTVSSQATTDMAAIRPFAGASVTNAEATAYGTATVMLSSAANGTLSFLGIGTLSADGTTYTVSGSPAAIQAALRNLLFTPTAHEVAVGQTVCTGLSLTVADLAGAATDTQTSIIATAADTAPSISTADMRTMPTIGLITPFDQVTIIDPDPGQTEAVTIVLSVGGAASDANGTLSGSGLTRTGVGTYALAAAGLAAEQASVRALIFTPATLGVRTTTDAFLQVSDGSAAGSATLGISTSYNPGGAVVTTNSGFEQDTFNDTAATQATTLYSTTIDAVLNGSRVVFEQVFDRPASDAAVQAAIAQADAALASYGATPSAPALVAANTQVLSSATATAETSRTRTSFTISPTTTTFGPNFLGPGVGVPNMVDGRPGYFYVIPGQLDLNINTVSQFTVNRTVTTTSTGLTTQHYVISGTGAAPSVLSDTASPAAGLYTAGTTIGFTLAFSQGVAVTGAPVLTLNDGGTATYASGSGGSALSFTTTVAAGQNAAPLAVTGVSLDAGSTIRNGGGIDADLSGAATSFAGLSVDTAAPAVSIALANDTGVAGDGITSDPSLAGTAEAGGMVVLTEAGTVLARAAVDAAGRWTATPSLALGPHNIIASEADAAGNTGMATLAFTLAVPTGGGSGDVHMTTFNGLAYDFQVTGDFTLAQRTATGTQDGFAVQMRSAQYTGPGTSVATSLAARVGDAVVEFGADSGVYVNGIEAGRLDGSSGTIQLTAGMVTRTGMQTATLTWDGGEVLTVENGGGYLDFSLALGPGDGPGSVQGLLGSAAGQGTDFQSKDGMILDPGLGAAAIERRLADAWQLPEDATLLSGRATATFTPQASSPTDPYAWLRYGL